MSFQSKNNLWNCAKILCFTNFSISLEKLWLPFLFTINFVCFHNENRLWIWNQQTKQSRIEKSKEKKKSLHLLGFPCSCLCIVILPSSIARRMSSPLLLQFLCWKTGEAHQPSIPCGSRKLGNAAVENDPWYEHLFSGLFKEWNMRVKFPELKCKSYFSSERPKQEAESKYSLED